MRRGIVHNADGGPVLGWFSRYRTAREIQEFDAFRSSQRMAYQSSPQPPDPLSGRPDFLAATLSGDDDLPPVEPPSAGFIVQLFVVPALIVAVIVAVYLLFGRLASGEQDWRKQLTDVRSDNPHVRWRGALGLAQMLQVDESADGERLAENRDVAQELAALLTESLAKASTAEDDLKQQEFLARTLGLVDVDDVSVPALSAALQPAEDATVRKNALAALATIANRREQAGHPFDDRLVIDDIIGISEESDAMLRHVATYTLGLFNSPTATQRLEVLIEHADPMTRLNAAVGLARRGSLAGLPVFEAVLSEARSAPAATVEVPTAGQSSEAAAAFEHALMLSNTLKALSELDSRLSDEQRQQFREALGPLAETYPQPQLRIEVQKLLTQWQR